MIEFEEICAAQIVERLGQLIGHEVELLHHTKPGEQAWFLVVPANRKLLRTAFWQAVQKSPSSGSWLTKEEAIVEFAANCREWAASCATQSGLSRELLRVLREGPTPVAALIDHFAQLGVSRHQLGRASRCIGVAKRKTGLKSGWEWALREGALSTSL